MYFYIIFVFKDTLWETRNTWPVDKFQMERLYSLTCSLTKHRKTEEPNKKGTQLV